MLCMPAYAALNRLMVNVLLHLLVENSLLADNITKFLHPASSTKKGIAQVAGVSSCHSAVVGVALPMAKPMMIMRAALCGLHSHPLSYFPKHKAALTSICSYLTSSKGQLACSSTLRLADQSCPVRPADVEPRKYLFKWARLLDSQFHSILKTPQDGAPANLAKVLMQTATCTDLTLFP
jgi:hypothetical protein